MNFEEWKLTQDLARNQGHLWHDKYHNKQKHAKHDMNNVEFTLTFEEYLFKAYEANIISPDQIGNNSAQYNLSRLGDIGGYTIESCRFILKSENLSEKNYDYMLGNSNGVAAINHTFTQGEKHGMSKLSEEEVIKIWYDKRDFQVIATEYAVHLSTIGKIKCGILWKSVTKNLVNFNQTSEVV